MKTKQNKKPTHIGQDQDGRCGSTSPTNTSKKPSKCRMIHTEYLLKFEAEDLKLPKRERNPPHNWVEQKLKKEREKRDREKGIRMGPALRRGS